MEALLGEHWQSNRSLYHQGTVLWSNIIDKANLPWNRHTNERESSVSHCFKTSANLPKSSSVVFLYMILLLSDGVALMNRSYRGLEN